MTNIQNNRSGKPAVNEKIQKYKEIIIWYNYEYF